MSGKCSRVLGVVHQNRFGIYKRRVLRRPSIPGQLLSVGVETGLHADAYLHEAPGSSAGIKGAGHSIARKIGPEPTLIGGTVLPLDQEAGRDKERAAIKWPVVLQTGAGIVSNKEVAENSGLVRIPQNRRSVELQRSPARFPMRNLVEGGRGKQQLAVGPGLEIDAKSRLLGRLILPDVKGPGQTSRCRKAGQDRFEFVLRDRTAGQLLRQFMGGILLHRGLRR